METIDAYKVANRIMNDKNISDDEWLQFQKEIRDFLKTDPPEDVLEFLKQHETVPEQFSNANYYL